MMNLSKLGIALPPGTDLGKLCASLSDPRDANLNSINIASICLFSVLF